MAFDEIGNLYVALADTHEVSVVLPSGQEQQRFKGPAKGPNGPIPWDSPAGVAFDNASGTLLVTNHALNTGLVLKKLFVVFDVYVNDRAHPLHRPAIW
jgi:DNA-binding beta-propeller fold protein YncE